MSIAMNRSAVSAESVWPIAGIYDDVVVTKRGVLCVGWELDLPIMYSSTEDEYDEMAGAYAAAMRVLPPWSVVHRQDFYSYDIWRAPMRETPPPFLIKAYEDHFEGRRYLRQRSYVFVSMCLKGHVEKGGKTSGVFGIDGLAKVPSEGAFEEWRQKCGEFESVMTRAGTGRIRARLLREKDWLGEGENPGIIQRYMMMGDDSPVMSDIEFAPDGIAVHDKQAVCFSVGDSEHLPAETATVRITELGSSGNDLLLSNGSPVGVDLDCEHVVSQITVMPPQQEVLRALETEKNRMLSGIKSVDNRINAGEIQAFLDAAYKHGLFVAKTNMSVIAWGDEVEARTLVGRVSTALKQMKVTSKRAKYNAPVVWYAGIPSCASEIGTENLMKMELHSAMCLGGWESFDRGLPGGYLRLSDRRRRIPLTLDMHRVAMKEKLISNFNIFVLGTSGSGKSFTVSKLSMDSYYAGNTEFIIDAGDSYEVVSRIIREESGGTDGVYLSWDEHNPMTFDAFRGWEDWLTPEGNLVLDEGSNYFMALVQMIYQPDEHAADRGWTDNRKAVLVQTITDFLKRAKEAGRKPVFDDYYRFINGEVLPRIAYVSSLEAVEVSSQEADWMRKSAELKEAKEEDYRKNGYFIGEAHISMEMFNAKDFALALGNYAISGVHGRLLNNPDPKDYFTCRHVVIEVQQLADMAKNGEEKYYGVCILSIMHQIEMKMHAGGGFKTIRIDEAWQAIANEAMAGYIRGLYKTARKYDCAMCVITQELADILSSPVVKTAIIDNSQIKILLDQQQNRTRFDEIQTALALTDKDRALVLSVNQMPRPGDKSKEVFINWGGQRSGVYLVEVPKALAIAFESNKEDKRPTLQRADEIGSIIAAIQEQAAGGGDDDIVAKVAAMQPERRRSVIERLKGLLPEREA